MGKCNEPCTYRLKRQNPDGYIHIECIIQPTRQHENTGVMNILSTVRETGGESLIRDTQKRLQTQLLELLVSSINDNNYFNPRCYLFDLWPRNHVSISKRLNIAPMAIRLCMSALTICLIKSSVTATARRIVEMT
jgi:hypothetical protein